MKKNIIIQSDRHSIELITNGNENFDNIVICFHGFNGDKWGDSYSGLKRIMKNSLVCSFDSCGHGQSEITSEQMRLDIILKEIDDVVNFLKQNCPNKPIMFVAHSYGAYRVMLYLIKYRPQVERVVYVNPAFRFLDVLQFAKGFRYELVKENELVEMKKSLNKFMTKSFLDDLYENNLYSKIYDISYESNIVVGEKDSLIPRKDIEEIAQRYNYLVSYVDDDHCFENKENWQVVADLLEGNK